jgi:serine/threonine-protein kinase RsbW
MEENREMVKMLDEQTVEVSLPSKLGYERIAMECSASFAKIVGFVSERIEDLKTAVAEACLNAIEHGNKLNPEARVIVTINHNGDTFSVSVLDEGDGIPDLPNDPDIKKKIEKLEPPNGLGIYLIKQLVDQAEFNEMTSEGHLVKLIIRMRG